MLRIEPRSNVTEVLNRYTLCRGRKGGEIMATILGAKKEKGMEALGKLTKGEAKAVQSGKEAILEILARAADDSNFLAQLADNPEKALSEYYVLSWEERAALASGDIKKIESWVGKLDKRLATWLWCRLSQEKW
jgi:hypothetical protein